MVGFLGTEKWPFCSVTLQAATVSDTYPEVWTVPPSEASPQSKGGWLQPGKSENTGTTSIQEDVFYRMILNDQKMLKSLNNELAPDLR